MTIGILHKVEVSIVRIPEGISKWDLVNRYMRLRKEVFIDRMAWPLYQLEEIEFEQYDTVHSVYVIAHSGNEVFGGARLLQTSKSVGVGRYVYSYMIRDACRNLLPGLPSDLCDDLPPTDPQIWELTRFATLKSAGVGALILNATNGFLKTEQATHCLFLAQPSLMRMASRMGFRPEPLGGLKRNEDGKFLAFRCSVI